jgi:hypothetical protein
MSIKKSIAWFPAFARWTANASASPATFGIAVLTVIAWAATGPVFGYSDTWQLVIQHGHNDCDISDGLSHSEHAESGHSGAAT